MCVRVYVKSLKVFSLIMTNWEETGGETQREKLKRGKDEAERKWKERWRTEERRIL